MVTGGKDVGADSFVLVLQKTTMFMNQQQRVWTNNMVKPTTEDDVTGAVTIPDYPTNKNNQQSRGYQHNYQMVIPGKTEVDVTVKYPDGGRSHKVPVTVGEQADNDVMNQQRWCNERSWHQRGR